MDARHDRQARGRKSRGLMPAPPSLEPAPGEQSPNGFSAKWRSHFILAARRTKSDTLRGELLARLCPTVLGWVGDPFRPSCQIGNTRSSPADRWVSGHCNCWSSTSTSWARRNGRSSIFRHVRTIRWLSTGSPAGRSCATGSWKRLRARGCPRRSPARSRRRRRTGRPTRPAWMNSAPRPRSGANRCSRGRNRCARWAGPTQTGTRPRRARRSLMTGRTMRICRRFLKRSVRTCAAT